MATSVIAVEWLNRNSLRNYPFRENCGLRPNDSAGNLIEDGWHIPTYLITDFVLGVNGSEYNPVIYLKRLATVSRRITLTFANADGEDVMSAVISEGDSTVDLSGIGNFVDVKGVVCVGDTSRFFDETPDGLYSFSMEETMIEPSCIRPSAAGVNSIAVVDSTGYTTAGLRGAVKLVAGDNVSIKYDVDRNAIIFSATPNSGYTSGCECDQENDRVVRTINGIKTTDVTIVGDDCLDISTSNGIIKISDTCSKPCCGCAETTFINQTINDLQSSVTTLANNTSLLNTRIDEFVSSYLLARKTIA